MVKKQRRKIYVSLAFLLLWLCALSGATSNISATSGKAGDHTSYSMARVTAPTGLLGEEELSRTFFGGDIKLLPLGLPVPEFINAGIRCLYRNLQEATYHNDTADLRHHIEQLIFPFHFFY